MTPQIAELKATYVPIGKVVIFDLPEPVECTEIMSMSSVIDSPRCAAFVSCACLEIPLLVTSWRIIFFYKD